MIFVIWWFTTLFIGTWTTPTLVLSSMSFGSLFLFTFKISCQETNIFACLAFCFFRKFLYCLEVNFNSITVARHSSGDIIITALSGGTRELRNLDAFTVGLSCNFFKTHVQSSRPFSEDLRIKALSNSSKLWSPLVSCAL